MWRVGIETARNCGRQMGNDYLEIFYEALLNDPPREIEVICKFLEIPFDSGMIELSNSREHYGAAKGRDEIVRNNTKKYKTDLTASEIRRIEEIVYPIAIDSGYEIENGVDFRCLDPFIFRLLSYFDAYSMLIFGIREEGFLQGIRLFNKSIILYL